MRYSDPFKYVLNTYLNGKKKDERDILLLNLMVRLLEFVPKGHKKIINDSIRKIELIVKKNFDEEIDLYEKISFPDELFSLDEMESEEKFTPYHLSFLFQSKSKSTVQKSKGEFNTPFYVAAYIVKRALYYYFNSLNNKKQSFKDLVFGDIACGKGNLILALLYTLIQQNRKNKPEGENTEDEHLVRIVSNIYGFDIDQLALEISKLRIMFFFAEHSPKTDLNTIKINLEKSNSLIKEELTYNNFFDIILLNPPFITYGLRNGQKCRLELKNYLREKYFSAEYKLPLYPLFIERSFELLREGGVLGIISPDSYLLGRYYSKIRKFIIDNSLIREIDIVNYEPFDGVTLGTTAISFFQKNTTKTKSKIKNYIKEQSFYAKKINSYADFFFDTTNSLGYKNYLKKIEENQLNRFFLFFNQKEEKIVEKWFSLANTKLEDIVTIHTGIRSKIGQKRIVSLQKENKHWRRALVNGKQVLPFFCNYQGHWVNLDPLQLWSGGFNADIVEKPKILLRQTGDRLISCVDTEAFYHLNNIHTISPRDEDIDLYSISVILNSIEFNNVYQILSMEKGRTFAQIDMDFLLKIPVIDLNEKQTAKMQKFYETQHMLQQKGQNILPTCLARLLQD